jgi:hypothetical protein
MTVDLPRRIAIYIAAENRGDTETLAQCKTRCVCETVVW